MSAMMSFTFSMPTERRIQVRSYSRFAQLFVGELAVSMAGGMQYAGPCVGHMGYDADEFQPVHKFYRFLTGSVQAESDDTARAVWHIFLCQIIVFAAFQSAIVHPFHFRVGFQPFSHFLCVSQ